MSNEVIPATVRGGSAALAGAVLLVAGCASGPARLPPPALELLNAGTLVLPRDCEPGRGVVYRTAFVVQPDGRVTRAASESGGGCVQQALQEWVGTFEYRPVPEPTPAVVDWIGVSATRGS